MGRDNHISRVQFVARSLWEACQKATGLLLPGQRADWRALPLETQRFWIIEANELLANLERIDG